MIIEEPDSRFLEVECSECSNSQVIFNKPSSEVNCRECGELLCKPTGGQGKVETRINQILE